MNFKKLKEAYNKSSIDSLVENILDNEGKNGSQMMSLFRIVVSILLLLAVITNSPSFKEISINGLFFIIYIVVTIAYIIIIRKGNSFLINISDYFVILFDYVLIVSLLIYYTNQYSPDNFAFCLKNSLLFLLLIPLMLTLLRFRLRLVIFSVVVNAISYIGIVLLAFREGMVKSDNWYDYILGNGVYLPDVLITRPFIVLIIYLVVIYTIFRSVRMLKRLSNEKEQKMILSRYFSAKTVIRLMNEPELLNKGNHSKVTVFFLDIRNFTTYSEKNTPGDIVNFLSKFREFVVDSVSEYDGIIDKFIGDGTLAVFSASYPLDKPGQESINAIRSILLIREKLKKFNTQRMAKGFPETRIGIGVHTGDAFVGNVKSGNFYEYTVIGDVVNTASRIESLCKELQVSVLVSEQVWEEVKGSFTLKEMTSIKLRGREQTTKVYTIADAM